MNDEDDPHIVGVELLPQSLAVWRAINDDDPGAYPIRLRLSRRLNEFERQEIGRLGPPYMAAEDDAASVLLPHYFLEAVQTQLDGMNNQIANAAAIGRDRRDKAIAEDERLQELEAEINKKLRE